ncbi:MAG: transposase [Muribaculaceae bacterium]|nr:transposase [Muribaculaceae bacterium]
MSLSALYYHLVIRTKNSKMTITDSFKGELYSYMAGIIVKRGCRPVIINGMGNHIHFLIEVTPTICFSDIVHDLKLGATHYIKTHREKYPMFEGWGREYAVFSCSASDRSRIISYIKNQEEHHAGLNAEDELMRFCKLASIEYHDVTE